MSNSCLKYSYAIIGEALLHYESKTKNATTDYNFAFNELRENLVFTNVELLESYLEDLLNIKISDGALYIERSKCRFAGIPCELTLVLIALAGGLTFYLLDTNIITAILLTALLSLPLLLISYLAPFTVKRRMVFARALSKEIARRRGRDDESGRSSILISDFYVKSTSQGLPGAARVRYH